MSSEFGEKECLDLLCIGEELISNCLQLLNDFGCLLSDDLLDLGCFREGTASTLPKGDDFIDCFFRSRGQLGGELVELLFLLLELRLESLCCCCIRLLYIISLLLDDLIDGDPLLDRIFLLVENNILDGLLPLCRYLRDPQMVLLSNGCSKGDSCSSCTEEDEGEVHDGDAADEDDCNPLPLYPRWEGGEGE
ncbi:hypothetical protein PMAYCL1PPCAC_07336, partial [Pristionchus mayeri]